MNKILISILMLILPSMTEQFKAALKAALDSLQSKAADTNNEYDDMAIKVIREILNL